MKVFYDPKFYEKLKKVDVRIRKSVKKQMLLFSKSPIDPSLRNHALQGEWQGYRSIDITNDVRAIYKKVQVREDIVAYFAIFGTHRELYG